MVKKTLSPIGLMIFLSTCLIFGPKLTNNISIGEVITAPEAVYVWTAPEYGTPVDHYVVQILVNDVDTLTVDPVFSESHTIEVEMGFKYLVRVAAVDAAGTQGGYSLWAIPYTPELPIPEF